jgi:hypothetical protein
VKEQVGYLCEDHVDQSSKIARDCNSIQSHSSADSDVSPNEELKLSHGKGPEDILNEYVTTLRNFALSSKRFQVKAGDFAFDIATVRSEFPIPTLSNIKTSLKGACLNQSWLSAEKLFKKNKKDETVLHPSCISTWKLLVDITISILMYGYVETYVVLRKRMLSVFLQWCRLLIILDFNFIKLGKYKLAAFASYAKDSDVYPPSPFNEQTLKDHAFAKPRFIFDKQFDNWISNLKGKTDFNSRFFMMSLIDTLCRGVKKGADRPTKEMAHESNLGTFRKFTEPKPVQGDKVIKNPRLDTETILNPALMELEVIRSVHEVMAGCKLYEPKYRHFPSLSACVENKVSFGGSMTVVKKHIPAYPRELLVKKKYGMLKDPLPVDHCNHTGEDNPVVRTPIINSEEDVEMDTLKENGELRSISYLEISNNYENLGTDLDISNYVDVCLQEGSRMKLCGLLEAFKVRGISTANALETWILKPLQKFLSKQLLKHKCFAVTGTPLTEAHLLERIKVLAAGQRICSGDYADATNELVAKYTEVCVREICQVLGLPDNLTQLAINSLTKNTVLYDYLDTEYVQPPTVGGYTPDRRKRDQVVNLIGKQVEAQPMGKVLSFVVLCILNFTVCRKALEIDYGGHIPIADFPGLINGDDCCFPLYDFDIWVDVTAIIGLKNSVGKTFFSKDFIEMNSRSFILYEGEDSFITPRGDFMNPYLKEIPFVNFGLIKGLLRSDQGSNTGGVITKIATLGDCHQDMVRGLDFAYDDLDYLFRGHNAKSLESDMLSGIPFYLPKWIGALGLNPGPKFWEKIPEEHLRAASVIFQTYNENKPKSVSLLKSCLLDEEINTKQKAIAQALGVELMEYPFKSIQHENGLNITTLEHENQEVYTDMVEKLWRDLPVPEIKFDVRLRDPCDKRLEIYANSDEIEDIVTSCANHLDDFDETDIFLKAQQLKLKKALKHNGKLWRNAHGKILNCDVKPLPWYKLWHQKQCGYLPIVRADAVRDQRETQLVIGY